MKKNVFVPFVLCAISVWFSGCASSVAARSDLNDGSLSTAETEAIGEYCEVDFPIHRTYMKLFDKLSGEEVGAASVITCAPQNGDRMILIACDNHEICTQSESSVTVEDFMESVGGEEVEEEQSI